MPNYDEAAKQSMPDPDLKNLYEQMCNNAKHLEEQLNNFEKQRGSLTGKIQELERMIEALSAGINSAAQYFPSTSEPRTEPPVYSTHPTYREPGV
jgi:predicted transcriptional regulator